MRGTQTPPEFIYKKLCILRCLNFSHFQSTFHLMQYTCRDFPTAQNSFWTHRFWCLLVFLPFFVSPLPQWQNVPLWGLFSFRKIKKSYLGWGQVNRKSGAWGPCYFGQKLLNTQYETSHHEMGKALKESSKKFTEAKCSLSQWLQLVHWYTWVLRILTWWGNPVLHGARPPEDNSILGVPSHRSMMSNRIVAVDGPK